MEEKWRDVKGYEGKYQVSNMGRVKSLYDGRHKIFREKILKPGKDRGGYLYVLLCRNGEHKMYKVHRLVLMTFNPIDGMDELLVNHKDEDKTNNNLNNLEWCTTLYNNTYNDKHKKIGEKNTNGKCSIPIAQLTQDGELANVYKSAHDAEREGGYAPSNIIKCCKNKLNREGNNIYKSYKWCYLYEYISKIDPRIKKVILFDKEYLVN